MINYVLGEFVKKLNSVSLSAGERAVLRRDILIRTGLPAPSGQSPIRSYFVIAPSVGGQNEKGDVEINYELKLIESNLGRPFDQMGKAKTKTKMQTIDRDAVVKVNLNIYDKDSEPKRAIIPKTFAVIKIAEGIF